MVTLRSQNHSRSTLTSSLRREKLHQLKPMDKVLVWLSYLSEQSTGIEVLERFQSFYRCNILGEWNYRLHLSV